LGTIFEGVAGRIFRMTVAEIISRLEAKGDPKVRALNWRNGAPENHFGVKLVEIRNLSKEIKQNSPLAKELWATGNVDARLLATLIVNPKDLAAAELEAMAEEATFAQLADWLCSYVVKQHPEKESLRQKWMSSPSPALSRAGWSLTCERVAKSPEGLDISALLDRIDAELSTVDELPKWTMNFTLGEIGIHHPQHRARAVAIGEKHGAYKDWPVSKGCIPPYVPVWVAEIVKRQA
jgi:3-methyladenine DNA glycosylase AlkD